MARFLAAAVLAITTLMQPIEIKASEDHSVHLYAAPVFAVIRSYELGAEFRIGESLALGPVLYKDDFAKDGVFLVNRISTTGYGLRATWQFGDSKKIGPGWYLSGMVLTMPKFTVETEGRVPAFLVTHETSNTQARLVAGYRWYWGAFAMGLGAGIIYNTIPASMTLRDSTGTMTSNVEIAEHTGNWFKNGATARGEFTTGLAF